jgi:hypothetical protein
MQTLRQLFTQAESSDSFGPERLVPMEQALAADNRSNLPWYLRFLVGLGAWLASGFFIAFFLILIGDQDKQRMAVGMAGLVLLTVSLVVVWLKPGLFLGQCCLAASFAGQFMIYYGFLPMEHHTLGTAAVLSIGLAVALYGLYSDTLQRLVTCVGALQVTLAWIYLGNNCDPIEGGSHPGHSVLPWALAYWAMHLAGIAWCFMRTSQRSIRVAPLGYALVLSLAAWQVENLEHLWDVAFMSQPQAGLQPGPRVAFLVRPICTAVMFLGVVAWAAGGTQVLRRFGLPLAALALTLEVIIWFGAGGVILPLLLITLGFFVESRVIQLVGLVLLPIFLFSYYYNLRLDLLAKSVALAGSGLALLLLRAGLKRGALVDFKEVS